MRASALFTVLCVLALPASAAEKPAKELFGHVEGPAALKAAVHGFYTRGCLAGGVALPVDGDAWQAMRLSRKRNYGHPVLIDLLKRFAREVRDNDGWRGLLIGDLAQARGGPMLTGHRSHQVGLDADIWLTEMPEKPLSRAVREKISAISMLKDLRNVDPKIWTDTHYRILKRVASYKEVGRVIVHPAIKRKLCETEAKDANRKWLNKVRPWWGHHYHFHVRLNCPPGNKGCKAQGAVPNGDTCGKELAWWLSDKPWAKKKPDKKKKPKKKKPLTLSKLPKACKAVLKAKTATE